MKRSTFFKSILAVIAAPKILSEIKWVKPKPKDSSTLFKDLQQLKPAYYKEYVEKYWNEDFTWWLSEANKPATVVSENFYFYESQTGRVFKSTEAGPPVELTITKDNHG